LHDLRRRNCDPRWKRLAVPPVPLVPVLAAARSAIHSVGPDVQMVLRTEGGRASMVSSRRTKGSFRTTGWAMPL